MTSKSSSQSPNSDLRTQALESRAQRSNLKIQRPKTYSPVLSIWVLGEKMEFASCQALGQDQSWARAGPCCPDDCTPWLQFEAFTCSLRQGQGPVSFNC